MAVKLDRVYDSKGVISAGAGIYVYDDTLKKFVLLIPTTDMPAGAGAPDTIDNPILTTEIIGQIEGKQSVDQKEYTINWNRDNQRRLAKFKGKQCTFLERDGMEYTGSKFTGTISYGKDSYSDNAIMQGKVWITVNEDQGFVDDIRDLYALTAVITTPLPETTIAEKGTATIAISTSENATVTVKSEAETIATATYSEGVLTITGVKEGYAIISLTCSASGEATSERTLMVNVTKE
jgi:hypothetical protein